MEDRDYIIILYDYYDVLFNDKQKLYFEEYYFNNLSLGEISENYAVSRNAVHKCLNSVISKLYDYENKLHLYDKYQKILDTLSDDLVKNKIKNILDE